MESKEAKYRGHVVVLPYPSQGHINPLVQFAKRLASKGVKATVATTHYTVNTIHAPNVGVEPISDGYNESGHAQAPSTEVYLESFKSVGSKTLSEVIQKFENSAFPVNCIVYDSFFGWALDVARKHGIYGAPFFTYSAHVCSIYGHIRSGALNLPIKNENKPVLLDGLPPLEFSDFPSYLRSPEFEVSIPYATMNLNQFSNLEKNGKPMSETWPAKSIGPMIPSTYLDGRIEDDKGYGANLWKPLGEECMKWLDSKPHASVVYVAFGSMLALNTAQIDEIGWGLKNSGWNFLWVVKKSESSKLSSAVVEGIQEKGLVVTWCNQLEVLAHTSVGCFLTHCGWNSTLEGLSLGVPMVGVGKWADQPTNAKFIQDVWRVGVRTKSDEKGIVSREELERCVKEVMEGKRSEEIKKNVKKWSEIAKEAISEGGSSDKNIDEFVGHLCRGPAGQKGCPFL
ncbi:N-hydroxythioamide S-beta-glucosyltransferase [Ranunculus cassubicifolius]